MAKWKSIIEKGERVLVPLDAAAKLEAGSKHKSVALGLWNPKEDKDYLAAVAVEDAKKKRVAQGKIAKMRQS